MIYVWRRLVSVVTYLLLVVLKEGFIGALGTNVIWLYGFSD